VRPVDQDLAAPILGQAFKRLRYIGEKRHQGTIVYTGKQNAHGIINKVRSVNGKDMIMG
jgi:hypothetical protein